jgi:hypothetical protein
MLYVGRNTASSAMDTSGHDCFDERSNVFILDCSFSRHLMETSSIRPIPIVSQLIVSFTVEIPPEDHILLLGHK